jgi:hypothetical protein
MPREQGEKRRVSVENETIASQNSGDGRWEMGGRGVWRNSSNRRCVGKRMYNPIVRVIESVLP